MPGIPANGPATNTPGKGQPAGVTPKQIWDMLLKAGATPVQAAGIMGNMIAESTLNPEAQGTDSNGYTSSGLVQFNAQTYPGSPSLVTGHPAKDAQAQVNYLATLGAFDKASGDTPAAAAASFAENFERCQTCDPGGASNTQRQSFAQQVSGWEQGNPWPSSAGSASTNAPWSPLTRPRNQRHASSDSAVSSD